MSNTESTFTFDIVRTETLGLYMKHWGMPKTRAVTTRKQDRLEAYMFPAKSGTVARVATVGLSRHHNAVSNELISRELLLVLPADLGGATETEVQNLLLDVAAHCATEGSIPNPGAVIEELMRAPVNWRARGMLFDSPRGEPEELEHFHVGAQHVRLIWACPIYREEADLISSGGLDAFDAAESRSDVSIIDPCRSSYLSE